MSAAWQSVTLSEVCEFKPTKKQVKQNLEEDDLVSFAPMGDLGELRMQFAASEERPLAKVYSGYTYFADGDVLCAKITPCFENGKMGVAAGLTNGIGFGSSEYVVMRPSARILAEYLFYFMLRDEFRVAGAKVMTGAVGHKRVPKEYFEDHAIPLPPLEEQKRIVAVLDQALAALDRARANAEANLADAEELWLTTLREILGTLANDGRLAKVSELAEHKLGKMLDKRKNKGSYKPYLRNINVRWFNIDTDDLLEMKFEDSEYDRFLIRKGDLLICEGGYPGRAAISELDREIFYQKALHRVRFADDSTARVLMYWLFLQSETGKLADHFTGSGIAHFTGKALANFKMPVAQPELMSSSIHKIDQARRRIETLRERFEARLLDLEDLRQSILQKAFAGELT